MGLISWMFTEEPLAKIKIIEVEKIFGFKLPDDYVQCVMKNNGGFPEPNSFDCDDGSIEMVFNNLISFTNEDLNIGMFTEFVSQKLIPFARDPFGGLLCFDYCDKEELPKVIFYDCEEMKKTSVCDSFSDLLERLYALENI